MSDNGLWAKLWFESVLDGASANLDSIRWTLWTKLMVITKHLGTAGELVIRYPAHQICGMLHVTDGYVTLCEVLGAANLPNVTVTFNDSESLQNRYITVKFLKWTRYQGDYSKPRVDKFRAKNTAKCNDRHLSSTSHSSSISGSKKEDSKGENKKKAENGNDPMAGFDEFWADYPRRVKKPQAKSAWRTQKCAALLSTILHDIELRKPGAEWTKDNGEFIPYPASYLNARRWEDEPVEVAKASRIMPESIKKRLEEWNS